MTNLPPERVEKLMIMASIKIKLSPNPVFLEHVLLVLLLIESQYNFSTNYSITKVSFSIGAINREREKFHSGLNQFIFQFRFHIFITVKYAPLDGFNKSSNRDSFSSKKIQIDCIHLRFSHLKFTI